MTKIICPGSSDIVCLPFEIEPLDSEISHFVDENFWTLVNDSETTKRIMEKTKQTTEAFVGNATADIINKCGMVNVDGLTHFEPGQTKQELESFYEFKECKDENEYIKDYLMSKDENANAYQLAYDMSNDWAIEVPTWAMIQKAYLVGLAAAKLKTRINNERQEK